MWIIRECAAGELRCARQAIGEPLDQSEGGSRRSERRVRKLGRRLVGISCPASESKLAAAKPPHWV
jgi:hypothetical protein